jgi:hypothetical protein
MSLIRLGLGCPTKAVTSLHRMAKQVAATKLVAGQVTEDQNSAQKLQSHVVRHLDKVVATSGARGLASVFWSAGVLGINTPDVADVLVNRTLACGPSLLPLMLPQHLSMIAHGAAKAGLINQGNREFNQFLNAISIRAQDCVSDFKPQEITSLVWGLSVANIRCSGSPSRLSVCITFVHLLSPIVAFVDSCKYYLFLVF